MERFSALNFYLVKRYFLVSSLPLICIATYKQKATAVVPQDEVEEEKDEDEEEEMLAASDGARIKRANKLAAAKC